MSEGDIVHYPLKILDTVSKEIGTIKILLGKKEIYKCKFFLNFFA
jgi:hypothetical protein